MNWWLICSGIAVHLIFFYSIFDIYFTSPLVHGMSPQTVHLPPPAKRLVLFVADGLRADKFFELDKTGRPRAPYLREIAEKHGAWGVSHTRVPTESRPGHVALIAGFYEDVSAVAKGWKENPVEFDSVFNESQYTWSWGSPDILPMFSKGASGDHVHIEMYPGDSEDFAGTNLSKLDTWVFDKVKQFLQRASTDVQLSQKLQEEKVVLFLHLLGLDTNGHAHKPYSNEYLKNIGIVDSGIKEIVSVIENFFDNDGQTSYVFSSDHGMTNWGSHGAGHPSETLTPVVAWGSGIRGALPPTLQYDDGYEKEWNLNSKRSDVNQADIAPLMSSLVGIAFPLNSVGILPLDYLDNTLQFKAESIFSNAIQILEQFQIKMKQKQETTLPKLFTPFKELTSSIQANNIRQIRGLIQEGKYQEAILESEILIDLALQGLNYYHNYDRFFLGVSIVLGFLGWMAYILTMLLQDHTTIVQHRSRLDSLSHGYWSSEKGVRLFFILIGIVIALLLYMQSLQWTYYMYCLVPVILWHKVIQRGRVFKDLWWYITDHGYVQRSAVMAVSGLCGLEIIVLSFSYRELLSIGLVAMGIWPFVTSAGSNSKATLTGWLISTLVLAVFPLLPVVEKIANYYLVYLACVVATCLAVFACTRKEIGVFSSKKIPQNQTALVIISQLLVLVLSVIILWTTQSSIKNHQGLPLTNQVLSWAILFLSVTVPLLSSSRLYPRLISIMLSFLSPYFLLSTAHEALFIVTLCVVMYFWLQLETGLSDKKRVKLEDLDFATSQTLGEVQRKLISTDLRCAYFFIFFLIAAFFGTGNIASINSFDPASVLCFLTVFNPFIMSSLMMWKNVIPFILVACAFSAVHLSVNVPTQSLFLIVFLMSDFMAMNFFFLVKDYGSWLEIGTSISHYVIVMVMIIFLILLLMVSKVLTSFRLEINKKRTEDKDE